MINFLRNLFIRWEKSAGYYTTHYKGYRVILFRRYHFDNVHYIFRKHGTGDGVIVITSYPNYKIAQKNMIKVFDMEVK